MDLATGQPVTLRVLQFTDRPAVHAWLERCAASFQEPAASPLLDFGAAGRDVYFEAVGAGPPPAGALRPRAAPARFHLQSLVERLAEVMDTGVSGRPRSLEWPLPRGVDARIALHAVARESRLRGYIPVQPAQWSPPGSDPRFDEAVRLVLHGRHVLVVQHDGAVASSRPAAGLMLALGLDSARPHVLLVLRDAEVGYGGGAANSGRRGLRAREQQAGYGTEAVRAPVVVVAPGAEAVGQMPRPVGSEAELVRPRAKIVLALETASRGRHASAARVLRDALGMLTRRNDLGGAGDAALGLGRVLLARGQVSEAASAFENARLLFDRAGLASRAIAAAVFVGLAWTDAGRWMEAEAAIRAALIASGSAGDRDGRTFGGLALARCLFWQRRHREALAALPADGGEVGEPADRVSEALPAPMCGPLPWPHLRLDDRVARSCLAARIAMACNDLRAAGAAAATARERATLCGRPIEVAVACTAVAAVYAALGDAASFRPRVEEGLRAARLAHSPLRALRLRALLAEGLQRAGRGAEARPLVARLARLNLDSLPTVVRTPVVQAVEWKTRVLLTGGRAGCDEPSALVPSGAIDTVIEVLGIAQTIEDEEGVARKVVATLRARTGAAVTACFGLTEGQVARLAADGRDPAPVETAQRAAEAALAIAPGATLSGLEGAVPVRFGGRVIGALASRWPADVAPNWDSTGPLLSAVAAVLAPCLRAVLDRRATPGPSAERAPDELVGESDALRRLSDEIERAARAPFNLVIEGESGSGKELVARAIHRLGPRRRHRLCAVNCAALTDELLEAELFGHARGAFTGAIVERKGLFEEADGGTLVLDEVGELTPRAQAKLLRAIQEGEVRRLGENFSRAVDARIIAASNRSLRQGVEAGVFRRDLLYRLEVIRIVVPSLRERPGDIPVLAAHFWRQATSRLGSRATLAPDTLAALTRYDWPGNVRELQNVMAALAVAAGRRGSVGPERLPAIIAGAAPAVRAATLDEARRVFETRFVRAALARAGGNRAQAARDLGLTRQGLAKLVARLGIEEGVEAARWPRCDKGLARSKTCQR